MPTEYSTVIQMSMPYLDLNMPLRVLTGAKAQKIEFYNGLEVDVTNGDGTYKYVFKNGIRGCMHSPPSSGPMALEAGSLAGKFPGFLPDLTTYAHVGDELVGGIMCQKFTLDTKHGGMGTMDDHIAFFWDAVLGKPVRWHMHSRHVTFGSHTDEYIMDYLSFQASAPSEAELAVPPQCLEAPTKADISIQIGSFLTAAHAMRAGKKEEVSFEAFLAQHGKSYAPEEHSQRRKIFEKNVRLVEELNQRHAGRASFKRNQFLDMTKEEVLSFRGGKNKNMGPSTQRRSAAHQLFVSTHEATQPSLKLPINFDWRTERPGVVGPVKDQLMCGSCWAYGALGPIESALAIRTGTLTLLPEQFIVDCAWTNGTGSSGGNFGCDGGDPDIGALEIIRKYGGVIPTAAAYGSYLSVDGYCKDTRLMETGAKITGWRDIEARDDKGLLDALVAKGPISVGIQVPDEMLYYESGVLNVQSCSHNTTEIDHAVVVTGYGTDEHGTEYYTIRNSWSTYWGDRGYINVARGELDCCVTCAAGYPEVDAGAAVVEASLVV